MKQMKIFSVLAISLALGLTACGGNGGKKGGTTSKHTHYAAENAPWQSDDSKHWKDCADNDGGKVDNKSHTFGDPYDIVAATCEQDGSQKVKCTVCQREVTQTIPATGHTWVDAEDQSTAVAPRCTEKGTKIQECSVCHQKQSVDVDALGHQWVTAEDQTGAFAPTCTEKGTEVQECSRCHEKQTVAVDALGHDFPAEGTPLTVPAETEKNVFGNDTIWAHITNYSCTRGDSYRYAWSAKEVNFDYKNVAEGAEPELLDVGDDGIRFWGRPIGNAMVLSSEGRASGNDDEKIPDETVKGSRFEFDFEFDADLTDVCLSALLEPAEHTNDIFKNRSQDQEWTPGYKFVDDVDEEGNPIRKAVKIEGMRFIIYLDGVEVPLDGTVDTRPNGTRWYQFPCKLNLNKGKHNLNIAMAGGYLHTFYQFSFEKVAPAHEHKFGAGTAQTDEALSKVATCPCGVEQIRWDAQNYSTTESSSSILKNQATGVSGDTATGMKMDGDVYNKTKGTASEGAHVDYNVNVPAAKTGAKLYIRGVRNSSSAVGMFSMQSNDNSKSYYEETAGEEWVRYPWRYKLIVNGVDVPFTPYTDENPEPSTGSKKYVEFAFPCTFNLQQGVNKIQLQKWGGYTLIITELAFEY